MKRRLLFISLILGVGFLILLGWTKGVCEPSKSPEMEYVPKILFTLNYGSADNQIGLMPAIEGAEGEIGDGPSGDFRVDSEENIYIGDFVNRKIKAFNKNGKYLFSIPWGMSGAFGDEGFRIDKERNIYVAKSASINRAIIEKYDAQGRFLHTIDFDPYRDTRDTQKIKALRASSPQIAEIPEFTNPPLVDSKGKEYNVHYKMDPAWERAEEIRVEVQGTSGAIGSFTLFSTQTTEISQKKVGTPSVKIPDYKDLKYGLNVRFVDKGGNIYASGLARREKLVLKSGFYINSDRIVYKYDSQGNFITQVRFLKFPNVITIADGAGYIVDPSGNIYTLQFHADRMDVVKYEWKPVSKKGDNIEE